MYRDEVQQLMQTVCPRCADALAGAGNPLIKQLRDALADIEEGYNPETPHMVKCWDRAREALYAADEFLASNA